MTLEEINSLLLEDYTEAMSHRLWNKIIPRPSKKPEFNDAELEAEFSIYKTELIEKENERLRRIDLKKRFENLKDMRQAFHSIHNEPNPALWFKNLLETHSDYAEEKIAELEMVDLAQQNSPDKLMKDFENARIKAYIEEGATVNGILEAIWEKVMENKPEKADALQLKRNKVKERIKKP